MKTGPLGTLALWVASICIFSQPHRKLKAKKVDSVYCPPCLAHGSANLNHVPIYFEFSLSKLEETKCAEENEILPISSAAAVGIVTMVIGEPSQSYQVTCYRLTNMSNTTDWDWVDCVVQMALAEPSLPG